MKRLDTNRAGRLGWVLAVAVLSLAPGWWGQAQVVPEMDAQIKARQHPSYRVFAAKLKLPALAAVEPGVIQIGEAVRLELSGLGRLSPAQRQDLAAALGVPPGVVNNFLSGHGAGTGAPGASNVIQALQAAVIDYQYLRDWWSRFNPPAPWQSVKTQALQSLAAGDLAKAWELYLGLPRPAPPKQARCASASRRRV